MASSPAKNGGDGPKKISHAYAGDAKTKQWRRRRRLLILVSVFLLLPVCMAAFIWYKNSTAQPALQSDRRHASATQANSLAALWKEHDNTQREIRKLQEQNRQRLQRIKRLAK